MDQRISIPVRFYWKVSGRDKVLVRHDSHNGTVYFAVFTLIGFKSLQHLLTGLVVFEETSG